MTAGGSQWTTPSSATRSRSRLLLPRRLELVDHGLVGLDLLELVFGEMDQAGAQLRFLAGLQSLLAK